MKTKRIKNVFLVNTNLHPVKINCVGLTDLKKYENDLNFRDISFPVKIKDIKNFESQNPNLPEINVFSIDEKNYIYPFRLNEIDCQHSVDLFLFEKEGKSHYSFIKDFSRLINSQVSKNTSKKYFWKKCLSHFIKEELLSRHISYCCINETVTIKMPLKNSLVYFENYYKKLPLPFYRLC